MITDGETRSISIATDEAIETIINKKDISNYHLILNVLTIVRNVLNSSDSPLEMTEKELIDKTISDIRLIQDICINLKVNCITYFNNYRKLRLSKGWLSYVNRKFKEGSKNGAIHEKTQKTTFKLVKENKPLIDYFSEDFLNGEPDVKCLIMTHMPVDLINYSSFKELDLLESHTGIIKSWGQFSTKLNIKKDMQIPFNRFTLQAFGDKNQISPLHINLRKNLYDIAEKYRWNRTTTLDRCRFSIQESGLMSHYKKTF